MTFEKWWEKKGPAIRDFQEADYHINPTMALLKIYCENAYEHGKAEGEKE